MNDIECNQSHSPALSWRSYHAPVIPARIQSFLWNPAESGGIFFGRELCQNCHSGDHLFQRNRAILELRPEWSQNGPVMNRLHIWHLKTQFCYQAHTASEHATYL